MEVLNGNFKHYELDNGLVVALQNTPTRTVSAKVRVNYGAYHESKNERGLAHFLEHCLVTGGSKKYGPAISDRIRGGFHHFNAQTSVGRTIFSASVLPEDLEQWLDLISDSLFYPRFDDVRTGGERQRVLREIENGRSNPYFKIDRKISDELYRGHPKGILISGDEKVVGEASQKQIRDFHRKGYNPSNMDLIVVGNLPKNTEELIKKYFGKHERGKNTRVIFPELAPLEKQTIVHMYAPDLRNKENPEASSASLELASVVAPGMHPDNFSLSAISHVLGEGTNSRFFKNIGLAKGLAYRCGAEYDGRYNGGVLLVNTLVPATRINEALDAIFEEMRKLRDEDITEEEIISGKKLAKFCMIEVFDYNPGCISAIEEKLDNGRTIEQLSEGFDRLTPSSIKEAAMKYLPKNREDGKYVLAIGDPLKSQD